MEDISCTPNFLNSTPPSPVNKSILRQLCRPGSQCMSRFTAEIKSEWPLKPARSRIIQFDELSATRGGVTDPRFRCATAARRAFYGHVKEVDGLTMTSSMPLLHIRS